MLCLPYLPRDPQVQISACLPHNEARTLSAKSDIWIWWSLFSAKKGLASIWIDNGFSKGTGLLIRRNMVSCLILKSTWSNFTAEKTWTVDKFGFHSIIFNLNWSNTSCSLKSCSALWCIKCAIPDEAVIIVSSFQAEFTVFDFTIVSICSTTSPTNAFDIKMSPLFPNTEISLDSILWQDKAPYDTSLVSPPE